MEAIQWIDERLSTKIYEDENGKSLVLNVDGDRTSLVQVSVFITFFGASIEDDTKTDKYLALLGPQTFVWSGETLTRTGVELGYKEYFDAWHEEGLI